MLPFRRCCCLAGSEAATQGKLPPCKQRTRCVSNPGSPGHPIPECVANDAVHECIFQGSLRPYGPQVSCQINTKPVGFRFKPTQCIFLLVCVRGSRMPHDRIGCWSTWEFLHGGCIARSLFFGITRSLFFGIARSLVFCILTCWYGSYVMFQTMVAFSYNSGCIVRYVGALHLLWTVNSKKGVVRSCYFWLVNPFMYLTRTL